ncbi:MAG TPA: hypothetical protein VGN26_08700 [Armatimonadota bacterium]
MRLLITLTFLALGAACGAQEVQVDFGKPLGQVRPLHGVNGGPLCYRGTVDLSAYHKELGIPLTRLHDVPWVNAEAVDIHTLFPDFRRDPDDPSSYDFRQTDDYIDAILKVGSRVVYRLGESIEHTSRKYHVNPPADPEKWARVCLGVVRHYNDGWAGGFHHGIRYWEIWNEPDVRPAMWTGTDEEFLHLYEVTARALKTAYPNLRVGGPAIGGSGEYQGDTFQPSPFLTRFLTFCRDNKVPLDFFSWHRYTSDPRSLPRQARAVRKLLDEYGFAGTESHLNEWNYLPGDDWGPLLKEGQGPARDRWYARMGSEEGAAFATAGLLLLQDAPVDAANYYTGEVQGFGLFNFSGTPKKSFYAFKAFRELLDTPNRVALQAPAEGSWAAIAGLSADRASASVMLSHWGVVPAGNRGSAEPVRQPPPARERPPVLSLSHLPWTGDTVAEVFAVDATHNLERLSRQVLTGDSPHLELPAAAPTVLLVRLTRGP